MTSETFMWTLIAGLLLIGIIAFIYGQYFTKVNNMTIYINHNHPMAHTELIRDLIQTGISNQQLAAEVARYIIDNRVYTWRGINFVHYG